MVVSNFILIPYNLVVLKVGVCVLVKLLIADVDSAWYEKSGYDRIR